MWESWGQYDSSLKIICELLETDDLRLREILLNQKDRFTGFFEKLAIMHNSGVINDEIRLYMFGYFAIQCNQSKNFWCRLNCDQPLWALFFSFADDMDKAQKKFKFNKINFHIA